MSSETRSTSHDMAHALIILEQLYVSAKDLLVTRSFDILLWMIRDPLVPILRTCTQLIVLERTGIIFFSPVASDKLPCHPHTIKEL